MSYFPEVSRRDILRAAGAMCIGLLAKDVLAFSANTLPRLKGGPVRQGQILSRVQMQLLRELVELIVPATDTLGAAATDTHGFIDDQLAHCLDPDKGKLFIAGLDSLAELVKTHWDNNFWLLSASQKVAAMGALANGFSPFSAHYTDWFHQLKGLTVMGYYLSEVGASQELVYDPVPGGYQGDFKVSDNNGKSFAVAFYSN